VNHLFGQVVLSGDPFQRAMAADLLGKLGPAARLAIAICSGPVTNEDENVRGVAK
jgi:hypothetical protein